MYLAVCMPQSCSFQLFRTMSFLWQYISWIPLRKLVNEILRWTSAALTVVISQYKKYFLFQLFQGIDLKRSTCHFPFFFKLPNIYYHFTVWKNWKKFENLEVEVTDKIAPTVLAKEELIQQVNYVYMGKWLCC